MKRPGNGISPMKLFTVLGKNAKKNFVEDELIKLWKKYVLLQLPEQTLGR